jgi:hypothetical protein
MDKKPVGVWLDHSKAHLITFLKGDPSIETIESPHQRLERVPGQGSDHTRFRGQAFSNNEDRKQNKEKQEKQAYYKSLMTALSEYKYILLFGPTNAKVELFHLMSEDKGFSEKLVTVENADKLTRNQMVAFVKDFFGEE